jgi:hypothetical protein
MPPHPAGYKDCLTRCGAGIDAHGARLHRIGGPGLMGEVLSYVGAHDPSLHDAIVAVWFSGAGNKRCIDGPQA